MLFHPLSYYSHTPTQKHSPQHSALNTATVCSSRKVKSYTVIRKIKEKSGKVKIMRGIERQSVFLCYVSQGTKTTVVTVGLENNIQRSYETENHRIL
jgi:hypothetical protein